MTVSTVFYERWNYSYILIHQLSSAFWGKYAEFKDEKANLDSLMQKMRDIYGEYTRVPADELEKLMERDLWWDAKRALELGLVDEIV